METSQAILSSLNGVISTEHVGGKASWVNTGSGVDIGDQTWNLSDGSQSGHYSILPQYLQS